MVVGIGASAGGLKALKELFSALPADTGLAFVVVVHLSPEHPSHLADLLQPLAKMPVVQVTQATPMEANRVYVIPPGQNLSTVDTHLRLSDLEPSRRERAPIDRFLETLTRTHGARSLAVVLSGTGTDGTLGVKLVKEAGGLTLVQDPNEADFDGMPQSAIATELVDLVLPVKAMPEYILRFARTRPKVEALQASELPDAENQALQQIFAQLRARTGQDFAKYKRSTVLRRLQRRMQLHQKETLQDYLAFLRESAGEVRQLADDFLITVTQFFRDQKDFEYLEHKVIPKLFEGKGAGDRIRVWSVGCATGEEAYSIAMLLREQSAALWQEAPELQVFASDLHDQSLRRAREGVYPESISADMSPERLQRFFTREDNSYRVRKDLRDMVVFAAHNLLRDPPFSHVDLIVCRNLLIYLEREAQHDVLELFHYALNPDGALMLGPSELAERPGLFRAESKRHALYRRRNVPPPEPRLPVFLRPSSMQGAHPAAFGPRVDSSISYGALHERIVERYSLPSMLVNQENHVVHVSETAGRYLQVSGGDLSANAFRLTREELRLELRSALQAAAGGGKGVRTKPVAIRLDGQDKLVVMHVRPSKIDDLDGFYLVMFDEMEATALAPPCAPAAAAGDAQKQELEDARAQLRAIVEQYESNQEEMKASYEELQSVNEELRSAMEELETSKEELQSMNEELQTVNQENRHKVEELAQLTSDLNNLISATEIATLFLDRNLRILRVTPRVADLFNVRSSDRGRPLTDFTNRVGYAKLPADAQRVLDKLIPVEREVQSQDGAWYLMRILPYRAGDQIQGIVVTFVEITERKKAELALRESEESFRALVTASAQIVWRTNAQGEVVEDSDSWRAFTGQTLREWQGNGWLDAVHPDDRAQARDAWQHSVAQQDAFETEFRLMHTGGGWRWMHVKGVPLRDDRGALRGWVGMNSDVTERRRAEEELRQVDQRKDTFLATLGHELRNPLAPLRTVAGLLEETLPDDPRLQRLHGMLGRQIAQLTRLVDDLLEVSRIKSGRVRLRLESLDLRAIVCHAVASMEPTANARKQELRIEKPNAPVMIEGDRARLEQVVTNLLDNACKYTPEGGRIDVEVQPRDGRAEVIVKDNGVGIASASLEHIFEAFARGIPSSSDTGGGLGIGLTLVRQLVELHGGTVAARSAGTGQGSEFAIHLPLHAAPADSGTAPGAVAEAVDTGAKPGTELAGSRSPGRRILIVDDNHDAADSLALMLEIAGHDVRRV